MVYMKGAGKTERLSDISEIRFVNLEKAFKEIKLK
jgi:hypothetical protein